jgi:hypothetical protein
MKKKESKSKIRDAKFELCIPMHLRKLRYDLQRYSVTQNKPSRSVLKKFTGFFEN